MSFRATKLADYCVGFMGSLGRVVVHVLSDEYFFMSELFPETMWRWDRLFSRFLVTQVIPSSFRVSLGGIRGGKQMCEGRTKSNDES